MINSNPKFIFSCYRKTSKSGPINERQRKIPGIAPCRREFVPFLGLILVVLAILAYYLGRTQNITIRGKNQGFFLDSFLVTMGKGFNKLLKIC